MKVAFIRRLPRERQEKLFDIWLLLQRDSTGGYSGDVVAEAIIQRALQQARAGGTENDSNAPQWYRRYRLTPRPQTRPRSTGAARRVLRRAIREAPAAA